MKKIFFMISVILLLVNSNMPRKQFIRASQTVDNSYYKCNHSCWQRTGN